MYILNLILLPSRYPKHFFHVGYSFQGLKQAVLDHSYIPCATAAF